MNYNCQHRGVIDIKNRSNIVMYYVIDRTVEENKKEQ